ncbi:MAG: hypothetical protein AAFQ45_04080 [Pseudomonadota bacterium]
MMAFHSCIAQKKLKDAGVDPALAHGLTAILEQTVVATAADKLVTRDDLHNRLGELLSDVKSDSAALRGALGDFKSELLQWTIGLTFGAALTIVFTLLRMVT